MDAVSMLIAAHELTAGEQVFYLLAAALFIALNGLYVAGEFSLVKVPLSRLEERVKSGSRAARWAHSAHEGMDSYLSLCQIGITLASLALGWIGEPAFAGLVTPVLKVTLGWFGQEPSSTLISTAAITLAFITISFLHVVVGEQLPKMFAITKSETTLLWTALPMRITYYILMPAVSFLKGSTNVLLRMVGVDEAGVHDVIHTEDELLAMVSASHQHGYLEEAERAIIHRAFKFHERQVEDVMVPRMEITYLDVNEPPEANWEIVCTTTHSRYPLVEGSFKRVLGIVHVRDIMRVEGPERMDFAGMAREIPYVPETATIDRVLRNFQRRGLHMALVIDEYGGVSGLVTIEDILEEIVGEIWDEFDEPEVMASASGDGWTLAGRLSLADVSEELGEEVNLDRAHTLAGLVLGLLGHIPHVGEAVQHAGFRFEVKVMDGYRIDEVAVARLEKKRSPEAEGEAPPPEESRSTDSS